MPKFPTFDEWFEQKYGETFNKSHQYTGNTYDNAFRALTREMRDYVSEMVAQSVPNPK